MERTGNQSALNFLMLQLAGLFCRVKLVSRFTQRGEAATELTVHEAANQRIVE
jgi:hypothetical protein